MDTPFYQNLQEPTRNESVAVGVSSIVISSARQGALPRKSIAIRNISPNAADIITVNFGQQQAVANAGVVLRQNELTTDSDAGNYQTFQGVITAICATANGLLAIYER